MADPHVRAFGDGGRVYMYSTRDTRDGPLGNGTCCQGQWWVWTSSDLVHWTNVSSLQNFAWTPPDLVAEHWATDAAERNGRYFWYVSVGGNEVAVATSDTPTGPWSDPLGKPLLSRELGQSLRPATSIRDPGTLQDDDGRYYIVFGACNGPKQPDDSCYYAAELNDDMITFKTPRHLSVQNAMGPYGPGKADDKPFLHKRAGVYYLSWGCFYATSPTVYGPYRYQGSVLDTARIAPEFRYGDSGHEPWYEREDYADRHGSFLELHGQWYFFANDRSHSDNRGVPGLSPGSYRDTVAGYVHYYDNGTIAPIVIDAKGVGSHDFEVEDRLPAENYFSLSRDGAAKSEGPEDGFQVVGLKDGSRLAYGNVHGLLAERVLWLRVANGSPCRGRVDVEARTSEDSLLARCDVPTTGGWSKFVEAPCRPLRRHRQPASVSDKRQGDLHLTFHGCSGDVFASLDWIRLESLGFWA